MPQFTYREAGGDIPRALQLVTGLVEFYIDNQDVICGPCLFLPTPQSAGP